MANLPSMNVTVIFTVTFDARRYYTEAELAGSPGLASRLRGEPLWRGSIDVATDGATLRIADELTPLVQNLCLRAVPPLAAGRPFQVDLFTRTDPVQLSPRGTAIDIATTAMAMSGLDRRALLNALVACGARYLAFAKHIKVGDPAFIDNLKHASSFEAAARKAAALL
jgi:hypothetical protein